MDAPHKYARLLSAVKAADYDQTCYIVGGGPSLKNFDWSDLDGKFVIAINRAYEVLPNAQIVYFTDKDFWNRHKDSMLAHSGAKVKGSLGNTWVNKEEVVEYLLSGPQGMDTTPGHLRHGYNSTYAALNLVTAHMGFKKVYLLGIDMKWSKGNGQCATHWHDGHARIDPENVYDKMSKAFNTIVLPLEQLGVKVYNVTRDSGLQAFEKVDFTSVFGDKYAHRVMGQDPKLLGDKVEEVLESLGAKKVVRAIERITKKPCNCGQRKQALNNLHKVLKR